MRILLTFLMMASFFVNAEKHTAKLSDGTKCNYETNKGMLDGEYKSYYGNGRLKCEGSFLQNNRFGFWVFYQPTGDIQCIRDYKNNYSYEEKSSDNKIKKVACNENNTWTVIPEKEIITKASFFTTILMEKNKELFANEKLIENIQRVVKTSNKEIYADYRFVTHINKDVLNNENIIGFQIKENRILDKATQMLQYRIVGIAPIVHSKENNTLPFNGTGPKIEALCWIYYPEIKSEFGKIKLNNPENTAFSKTLLDIFENRSFSSKIDLLGYMHSEMNKKVNHDADNDLNKYGIIMDIEQENTLITNNFATK